MLILQKKFNKFTLTSYSLSSPKTLLFKSPKDYYF